MHLAFARWLLLFFACHAAAAESDWSVRVAPYNRVFPALELSQARRTDARTASDHVLGNGSGLIAVHVRARHANERVILGIRVPELGAAQRFAATLAQADTDYDLHPPLAWDVERLRSLTAPLASHLFATLERDGAAAGERDVVISLRPLHEALYFVRDGGDSVDLSWIFAAYVDEYDPVVDAILDAARKGAIAESLDGSGDRDAVYRQVWAIWQALLERGIRYSRADPAIEHGPRVFSQRVRFLADTWTDRSANCVDGSVLIASVLKRIGLRSFLVLVPGHAFVGFYTDGGIEDAAFLETTLLGAQVGELAKPPAFAAGLALTARQRASLANFSAALAAGRAHHARVAAQLDGQHRPDYVVIDIDAARAFGIDPVAATHDANRGGAP